MLIQLIAKSSFKSISPLKGDEAAQSPTRVRLLRSVVVNDSVLEVFFTLQQTIPNDSIVIF
jgi:hypothetical protein